MSYSRRWRNNPDYYYVIALYTDAVHIYLSTLEGYISVKDKNYRHTLNTQLANALVFSDTFKASKFMRTHKLAPKMIGGYKIIKIHRTIQLAIDTVKLVKLI